jgi:hypothetical protein
MFGNLKQRNDQPSVFKDAIPKTNSFHRSPGAETSVTKDNESRFVRCRVCGFICDRERDAKIKDGSFAGLGVSFSEQKTASASVGDAMVPAAGTVTRTPDKYYDRTIQGGCPFCASYLYDEKPQEIPES